MREEHEPFLRDARPDLPDSFVQIVEGTLSVKPEDRYASAGAIEAALAAANEAAHALDAPTPAATRSVNTTIVSRRAV
jgi:hypothetical protein